MCGGGGRIDWKCVKLIPTELDSLWLLELLYIQTLTQAVQLPTAVGYFILQCMTLYSPHRSNSGISLEWPIYVKCIGVIFKSPGLNLLQSVVRFAKADLSIPHNKCI